MREFSRSTRSAPLYKIVLRERKWTMSTLPEQPALKILLADDGSEHARAAVSLLGHLPLPPKSTVTALRVFTPLQISEHAAMQKALDQTQASLLTRGIQSVTELLLGYPAEKLSEYADQHRPDLIVMGAKGLRATLSILLGGVAQQMVEYAQWPVLIVRAPYHGLRRLLLVTDGSSYSQQAVDALGKIPLPSGIDVRVMHVMSPPPHAIFLVDSSRPGIGKPPLLQDEKIAATQAFEESEGQALLARTLETLQAFGLRATGVLKRGDAATEIIQYAHDQQIDLIVAGSRGLSRVTGWLMGSVSRKLVHYAGCSVMIVKGASER
jgi:nucleotide-binding universal stress UspA family protein